MTFTKRLRAPIMRGEITCSVRIWQRPHVKLGGHYRLGDGFIEVTSIRRITMADITPELARRSGFVGVVDLLKVAKHGPGEKIYLIDFAYHRDPRESDSRLDSDAVRAMREADEDVRRGRVMRLRKIPGVRELSAKARARGLLPR